MEDHQHAVELQKEKHESQLNFARKEHQLTVTKDNDTIVSLEQQIIQLKQVGYYDKYSSDRWLKYSAHSVVHSEALESFNLD